MPNIASGHDDAATQAASQYAGAWWKASRYELRDGLICPVPGAPIDLYGVGTDLATSRDAPALGGVYKLVAVEAGGERRPVRKLGAEKATYPGPKQVYRRRGPEGRFGEDVVALATETLAGEPLLVPVVDGGEVCAALPALPEIRARARAQVEALPPGVRRLEHADAHRVGVTPALRELAERLHPEG